MGKSFKDRPDKYKYNGGNKKKNKNKNRNHQPNDGKSNDYQPEE
jgi:hypothetical protein